MSAPRPNRPPGSREVETDGEQITLDTREVVGKGEAQKRSEPDYAGIAQDVEAAARRRRVMWRTMRHGSRRSIMRRAVRELDAAHAAGLTPWTAEIRERVGESVYLAMCEIEDARETAAPTVLLSFNPQCRDAVPRRRSAGRTRAREAARGRRTASRRTRRTASADSGPSDSPGEGPPQALAPAASSAARRLPPLSKDPNGARKRRATYVYGRGVPLGEGGDR